MGAALREQMMRERTVKTDTAYGGITVICSSMCVPIVNDTIIFVMGRQNMNDN